MTAPSIVRVGYKGASFTFALQRPVWYPERQTSVYMPAPNAKPFHKYTFLCVLPPRPAEPTSAGWSVLADRAAYLLRRARLRGYLQARKARRAA